MKRNDLVRLRPLAKGFWWLAWGMALALCGLAAALPYHAVAAGQPLLIARLAASARENAAALLAVGALISTGADLILRQYLPVDE